MAESPPKSPAKKTPAPSDAEFRALLLKNVNKIRAWYAKQPGHGQELGHYVMLELVMGHFSLAIELSMQGKEWEPA